MGRPRVRSTSTTSGAKRRKTRRDSASYASSHSDSDHIRATMRSPEQNEVRHRGSIHRPSSTQYCYSSPFESTESSLLLSYPSPSATPTWPSQVTDSDPIYQNSNYGVENSTSQFVADLASLAEQADVGDLLAMGLNPSSTMIETIPQNSGNRIFISSTSSHPGVLDLSLPSASTSSLPQILFELRTASQTLKSAPSSSSHKDQIIATVSSLCDITKSSKACWESSGQLPSPDIIILATTVSLSVDIYSVLMDEMTSASSIWACRRPQTEMFLKFHEHAFAINFHLTELKEILNMAGLAAYDVHTIRTIDEVHTAAKELLLRWQTC